MDEALLIRYLNHDCTPAEIAALAQWVAADGEHAGWLFEMESLWALKNEQLFSEPRQVDAMYDRLRARLHRAETVARPAPRKTIAWPAVLKYAAAAVIAALLSVNIYYITNAPSDTVAANTVEVPAGQRIALTLSDGTRVWLNAQTVFTYPSHFSTKTRTVRLNGEAFFEVARNESKPFVVEAALLNVKVLGTKFNMKTYPHEIAAVTLSEGKVEVSAGDSKRSVTLLPNEEAVYSATAGLILRKGINPDLTGSWTVGELSFYNQTLADIAADLERRFDVRIRITGEDLADDKFTGRFKEHATIEQILTNLKDTKRLNYKIEGEDIEIIKP